MKIIKADNYQSWYIEYLNNSIIIDPWLTTKLQPENSFFIQRSKNRRIEFRFLLGDPSDNFIIKLLEEKQKQ